MVITQYGRVELDPMRVPQAASMRTGLDDSFASRLQAVQKAAEPRARAPEPVRKKVEEAPKAAAEPDKRPVADEVEPVMQADETPATPAHDEASNPTPVATNVAIDVTDHTRRGEAERRIEAGKGTTSSLAFPAAPSTLPTAAVTATPTGQVLALTGSAPTVTATTGTGQTSVANAAKSLLDATGGTKGVLPRSEVSGYRTLNTQSINLLEQARDSVFKQIMLKLSKDGGEMRMRLEPPDLGELDLHMMVEKSGGLRLSIGAERPEVQQLLQRHLDELKQTLQANGFSVTHAEVRTQSDASGRRDPRGNDAFAFDTAPSDDAEPASGNQHVNYINAQGLDFWV